MTTIPSGRWRRPAAAAAGVLAAFAAAAAVAAPAQASPVYHDTSHYENQPYWNDPGPVSWGVYEDCPGCGAYEHIYDPPGSWVDNNVWVTSGYTTYSPDNTTRPALSGAAREKAVLSTTDGVWTNDAANSDPNNTYTYRWQICSNAGTACEDIPDATASTYTIPTGSAGKTFRAVVRGTNASGYNEATTLVSAVTTLPVPAPDPANPPKLPAGASDPVSGQPLTATKGTWDDASSATFTYQWQRCDAPSTNEAEAHCVNIPGAMDPTYTPGADDVGKYLRVVVTAHNAGTPDATSVSGFSGKVKAPAPASTAPLGDGGGVAPGGGGGGGGGGGKKPEEPTQPSGGGGDGGGGGANPGPKPRGAANGPGATDDATLKAVFSATKTTSLSTTYGQRAVVSGRLTTKAGDPLPKAKIDVTARLAGGGRFDDHAIVTDDDGRFSVTLPGNALSQTVRVSYRSHANDEQAAAAESLALSVRARAQLTVSASGAGAKAARVGKGKKAKRRTVARNGSMLTFRAQVVGPIPVGGKTVQLQSQCAAKGCAKGWANFGPSGQTSKTVFQRTDKKGRFVLRMRTGVTVGTVTYRFRLAVPEVDGASNDWPFGTGYSPVRTITIHGSSR